MIKFECPVCHKRTRIYAKDGKFVLSANVALRYRKCKFCGIKFVTKEDLEEHEETLLHLLHRSNKEILLGGKDYE